MLACQTIHDTLEGFLEKQTAEAAAAADNGGETGSGVEAVATGADAE